MQLIFLKANNNTGFLQKGDCIEVRASSTLFTGKEPDKFVMVDVAGVPMLNYEGYMKAWERLIDYEEINQNLSIDGFRIRLYSPLISSLGDGKITKDEVEPFINNWGGTVYSFGENEVVFDILIFDALKSVNFWEVDIANVIFTETNYNQTIGIHSVQIDYSGIGNNPTYIEKYVERKGAVIIDNANKVMNIEIHRSVVRNEFESDIRNKAKKIIKGRRYYIENGVVDYIIGQGGTLTTDLTTLLGYLQDKANG